MDTAFFEKNNIKFEFVSHPEIKEAGVAGAARVLNCPEAYIITTVLYDLGDKTVAAITGGGAVADRDALCKTTGGASAEIIPPDRAAELTGLSKLDISPLTISNNLDCIWDNRLFDYPYLIFAKTGTEQSIRVDTREFTSAGLTSAELTVPEKPASAYHVLLERGFIDRITDEDMGGKVMADSDVRCYIGFDPTADSLHVGSLVPIMALANIQSYGLKPIAIVGGGTALVGDPSGKTEMRKMLTRDDIARNMNGIRKQLATYITFDSDKATMLDNADWLVNFSYIDFLREVGVHFSVNRMLKADCFASRLEKGLSFIEFNYMLMQAYDFVHLAQEHNCLVQLGGSDQWGNICAGKDLAHRTKGKILFDREMTRGDKTVGVTFPLLKKASGTKFGKTEGGNIWLGSDKTTPYDFFQFWRNTEDSDIRRIMALFTFIPMPDVRNLTTGKTGEQLNTAKEITAFAATVLAHGVEAAFAAAATAKSKFGGYGDEFFQTVERLNLANDKQIEEFKTSGGSAAAAGLPTFEVKSSDIASGEVKVMHILNDLGFVASNGEAKRMIKQNAVKVNDQPVTAIDAGLPQTEPGGSINIKMGKKKHGIIIVT